MAITKSVLERNGFEKINNSMYKKGNITLQNGYTNGGGDIFNKIITIEKAYKVCINGKYMQMIRYEDQLNQLLERQKQLNNE